MRGIRFIDLRFCFIDRGTEIVEVEEPPSSTKNESFKVKLSGQRPRKITKSINYCVVDVPLLSNDIL